MPALQLPKCSGDSNACHPDPHVGVWVPIVPHCLRVFSTLT